MKIKYYGHACFALSFEGGTVLVTDPFDESVTYAPCDCECSAALVSHDHFDHNYVQGLKGDFAVIRTPGTHSAGDVKITAVESFHDPEGGALRGKNLIFRIEAEGLSIAHLGDLGHMPDDIQMEALKDLDVMMLPIGGTYTIDTPQAEELIRRAQPKLAIAMHYKTGAYPTINIVTPDAFIADMQAAAMPREIEVTRESIGSLPPVITMAYK